MQVSLGDSGLENDRSVTIDSKSTFVERVIDYDELHVILTEVLDMLERLNDILMTVCLPLSKYPNVRAQHHRTFFPGKQSTR